ncbi:hypothetical protein [Glycomyces buryatensis]|uniref:Uncharacterized protein n=1 Tax=Glycomyces buryatensis TaxID=2570927 RepID=A0A4S8QHW8_9ACTN|nr:hypothetical protein [Glycomyces buryatensis]THV42575.1 hypothetical protein FAB82_05225 [Glycomyces buryatensis]
MSYTAPDPAQFAQMEQAYSYMAPAAAIQIVMPTFTFFGPCNQISRIIYMNQCNPGLIMQVAANWLKLAEHYLAASEKLKEKTGEISEDDWSGDDRDSFDDKSGKMDAQLVIIAAFAMHVGISLFIIGTMLAVLVPLMLAVATSLFAMSVMYTAFRFIPVIGPGVAASIHVMATATAGSCLTVLEALDKAITLAAKTLASFIGANMGASWIALATKGNMINPLDTIGSTGFSLLQGLSQLALRNLMAPGRNATSSLASASPKMNNLLMKNNPHLINFAGGQGVYNIGNNINGDVNPDGDAQRWDRQTGVDFGGLDFIPNTFEDQAREDDGEPQWRDPDKYPKDQQEDA